ncbi:hypothetical protein QQS21_000179 [Conoideocrella luteorostrata]|uniref:N-acetyltransferase domain-containing protein n=1 Tax=Conoideocrella luteorostrata TaxID=1105319 RepID=A0AAJ0CZA6_9HYPO|nr:hypothetical protein QQS21_000179 [Conoideocrella luteorostrata]
MEAGTGSGPASITYRSHRPGDLGMMVHRHGVIYLDEVGCEDSRFESHMAQIAATFLASHDSAKERCWIAEQNNQFIGSIMLIKDPDFEDAANLRAFLVEPKARCLGVGKRLVRLCIDYARKVGYKRVRLRTDCSFTAARSLYRREGFTLVETMGEKLFDFEQGGEVWEMVF